MFAKSHRRSLILLIVATLTLMLTSLVHGASGDTTRVSMDSGRSVNPSISADGRYIAFQSTATNLVTEDDNAFNDIFVYDRDTDSISVVSVDNSGNVGDSNSQNPSVSSDGRYVAFDSSASNLVDEDLVAGFDVYVHDLQTAETTRVSVDSDGNEGNSWSRNPSISSDGRYVAFDSGASNLVSNDTNGTTDIFVRDREAGSTTRVSVASDGTEGNAYSRAPSISDDGRYIAFLSSASNLVGGDNNAETDVFVHDRLTETTTRVNIADNGSEANDRSDFASISADGRYITFMSEAGNLVEADDDILSDVFVHDRITGDTTLVSVDTSGNEVIGSASDISAHGRYIAFIGSVSDDSGSFGDFNQVYVHDRLTGNTAPVSVDSGGTLANHNSSTPAISAGGRFVAFRSHANNLVASDTNNNADIFVHELAVEAANSYVWGVDASTDGLSLYDPATEDLVRFAGSLDDDPGTYTTPTALTTVPGSGEILVWNNSDPSGVLLSVDPFSGLATRVDPNTPPQNVSLDEIAIGPGGVLYGTSGSLYEISRSTGAATPVASLGLRIGGLSFSRQGVLYGVELSTGSERLVTIDPATGAVTTIGTLSQDIGVIGDIVITADGRLFGSAFGGPQGNIFFDLDPGTAAVSNVEEIQQFPPQGMGLVDPFTFDEEPEGPSVDLLFWTDNDAGAVYKVNRDGSGSEAIASGQGFLRGIEVHDESGFIYFASPDTIWRADLDGGNRVVLYGGLSIPDDSPAHLALSPATNTLYWTDSDSIRSAPLDGSGVPQNLFTGLSRPQDLEIDGAGGKLYWAEADAGAIHRANLDSTGIEVIQTGLDFPSGLALDLGAGKLYFSDRIQNSIRRTNLDGSGLEDVLTVPNVQDVELDTAEGKLYWTNRADGLVQRANLDGSGVETLQNALDPFGLALAATTPDGGVDLQVVVEVDQNRPWYVGDTVGYHAVVRNNGPVQTAAELTIERQYAGQSSWVTNPPDAAVVNGDLQLDLGVLNAGETIAVPFAINYEAFGSYEVAATVAGDQPDPNPANNASPHTQLVNLLIDTTGVETGGLDLSGQATVDGEPLAIVGVRIPGSLIAGNPPGDIFVPSTLTPQEILSDDHFVPPAEFVAGEQFQPYPVKQLVAGNLPYPDSDQWPQGYSFIPRADAWLTGNQYIPQPSSWDPAGRLLVADDTTMLQVASERKEDSTRLLISDPFAEGLTVQGIDGTRDTAVDVVDDRLCSFRYPTHIGSGDVVTYTCGSLTTTVDSGEVSVGLPDGTFLDIPQDTTVVVTERSGGGFDVAVTEGGPITVTAGGFSFQLDEGQEAPDPAGDPDEDGVITALELAVGADPLNADSDGDGIIDGADPSTISLAVSSLGESVFAPDGLRTAMLARLSDIETFIYDGEIDEAATALDDLRRRLDGCGDQPDVNDWIIDCQDQLFVRSVLDTVTSGIGDL